jgi:hypothetical protein
MPHRYDRRRIAYGAPSAPGPVLRPLEHFTAPDAPRWSLAPRGTVGARWRLDWAEVELSPRGRLWLVADELPPRGRLSLVAVADEWSRLVLMVRAIAGRPGSAELADVVCAVRSAEWPAHGKVTLVVPDAEETASRAFRVALRALGIEIVRDPTYTPAGKGLIERVLRCGGDGGRGDGVDA